MVLKGCSDKRNARKVFGDKVIIEKPTLDDIMVYISRRSQMVNLVLKDILMMKKHCCYV